MSEQSLIDKIEREYNPEFDVPVAPEVTWSDYTLLELIKDLYARIEKLEKQAEDVDIVLRRNLPA